MRSLVVGHCATDNVLEQLPTGWGPVGVLVKQSSCSSLCLMKAKRPIRRQRWRPNNLMVLLNHCLWCGTQEKVEVKDASNGPASIHQHCHLSIVSKRNWLERESSTGLVQMQSRSGITLLFLCNGNARHVFHPCGSPGSINAVDTPSVTQHALVCQ